MGSPEALRFRFCSRVKAIAFVSIAQGSFKGTGIDFYLLCVGISHCAHGGQGCGRRFLFW